MNGSSLSVIVDKTQAMLRAMRLLTRSQVLVGIPADQGERKDSAAITNAEIGFVQEHGSPANNLPARPFLMPGVRAAQEQIAAQLREAGQKALSGDEAAVPRCLNKAGLIAQNSVRARFADNDWAPLSDKALDKRPAAQRDETGKVIKKAGKSRRERGTVNPLIDSGQLRKSITYVVKS